MSEPIDEWAWLQRPGTASAPADGVSVRTLLTSWVHLTLMSKLLAIVVALWAIVGLLWGIIEFATAWPMLITVVGVALAAWLYWRSSSVTMSAGQVTMLGRTFAESDIARVEPVRITLRGGDTTTFLFLDRNERLRGEVSTAQFAHDDLSLVLAPFAGRVVPTVTSTIEQFSERRRTLGGPRLTDSLPLRILVGTVIATIVGFVIVALLHR